MKKYDLSNIMKQAWKMVKEIGLTISAALKKSWQEAKNMCKEVKNVVVKSFDDYNARRYGTPWVTVMDEQGKYDFTKRIGTFTGNADDGGDLIVYAPVVGQVYGYGQKDYRGNNTIKRFCVWTENGFAECDKMGKIKEA